ncbi:NTM 9 [Spatholobus suberectus]|nr:NTM 9 [Spatholobus suberectus]
MENIVSILDYVPVGFRFRPTDEELVNYYLKHKSLGDDFPVHIIPEIDLCSVEPWDVKAMSVIKSDDPEWYFFSPVDYKYSNRKRVNRTTKRGFWKATGNDRNVRMTGTNKVIGTKKTLVFHEGRVPRGVKTNWVIHEYHAIASHESQGTFVLCRLMKKPGKTTEGGIEAPIFDEGEPSTRIVSDCDNQATAEGIPPLDTITGIDIEAIFQAIEDPIDVEQEAFNACFRNESINMQTPVQATDEDNDFVNSIWASDEEVVINEERRDCFVNSSTQPKSLRRVYNGSSDTDAEIVSNLHDNISSGEYPATKMFKSSHDSVRGGTSRLASNYEANIEKKESILQDDSWEVETSSCDSIADEPLEINCIEISSSPSTATRLKNQYHLRPDSFILQRTVAGRPQTEKKVSSIAVSHVEARKELLTVKSEKDQKNAQNTSSRENLETRRHQSSDVNRKGSFIYMETSSQSVYPRSVYLVNVVMGILLLIVISWEILSC